MAIKDSVIRTIAGNGEPGYGGDGELAAQASLNEPKGVTVDRSGNVYIADSENHAIRKVEASTGRIVTIAGQPSYGGGDAAAAGSNHVDESDEDVFAGPAEVTGRYTQTRDVTGTVRFVVGTATSTARFAGDGGPAVQAILNFPTAVAVDRHGHVYIADTLNHRIRKLTAGTGVISTIAGIGQRRFSGDGGPATAAALNEPAAVVCDDDGHVYIADQSNHRIRRVDCRNGLITTIAGTGEPGYSGDGMPAAESALSGPSGVAIDPDGSLYIADTFNGRIRKVDLATGMISTVTGDGSVYRYQGGHDDLSMSLSRPYGIAVDDEGNIFITDSDNHLVRRWDRHKRVITRVAGNGAAGYTGDGTLPLSASLNYPFGVALDGLGRIYVADTFNHRIRVIAVS